MNKLLIYYSLTGNGEAVASLLEEKGYEIRRVYEKHKMPKSFFAQMMDGGFRAGINAKGKLIDYNSDVSSYEEIVIGSPIWNGRFPPAINAVLAQTDLKDKKLTFVIYSGSGEGKKALKKINKFYPSSKVIFLKQPTKYLEEFEKLKELC